MQEWFYIVDGERRGPIDRRVLCHWLRDGQLSADTLVWSDGMQDWAMASDVTALRGNGEAMAVDTETVASPWADGPQVRPWVRCFARSVDVMLFSMVAGLLIGAVMDAETLQGNLVAPLIVLLSYAFVEPLMLSRWGTTPGKALLRVRVRRKDGGLLSYREALERSLHVWARGLGMGLPLIGLIAQFIAYQELLARGATAWDRLGGYRVEHARIGQWRVAVMVGMLTLGVVLALVGAKL